MPVRPISVGERIKRREDPRLIRGLATYTDDIKLHGMLHAAFVRSDYAAGRIEKIDLSKARARKGVIAAYTFDDLRGKVGRTPCVARPEPGRDAEHPLLADRFVRWVGQPVAVVIAEDRYVARDAALDVTVDISPSHPVIDLKSALDPSKGKVYADHADNVAIAVPLNPENAAAVDKLFKEADGVIRLELVNQKVAPVSMEPRAVLAHWDEGPQRLTVWTSTQVPHLVKQQLAQCLGLSEVRIRVVAPEVGGGFGCKIPVYAEECLLPWISRQLRRPIKWAETRTENLLGTTHGRAHIHEIEAAYKKTGELVALRGRVLSDVGAYPSFFGPAIATFTPLMMPGCYTLKGLSVEVIALYTNTMATDAYRGAGRPEAAYTVERVMDAIAAKTGLDPVDVRRKNFIPKSAFPYTTASGAVYDSGDYGPTLDKALERFDYAGAKARREKARAEGRLVGIGVATFTEICGLGPSTAASPIQRTGSWESGMVRVEPTGNVVITTGASPHGQGQETAFAQMAADAFGVDVTDVEVLHGDTDVVTHGVGTFGSRGLVVGGTAVHMALEKVKAKAQRIAAHLLDARPDQVTFEGDTFQVTGSERKKTFREVAEAAHLWNVPVPGEEPGLEAVARFEPTGTTFPFGSHLCEVEVDPDTGEVEIVRYVAVDDAGKIVNPLLAEGQRLGGIVQGLGQALCEEVRYDENGQLLTATLMDYAMPKAHMFPRIELDTTCTPTHLNPLGAKGIGELGTIGSTPCLVSAVLDALKPRGVTHIDMPLTPLRVWTALQGGGEMIAADFEYFAPRTVREAVDLLTRNADAKLLGGGMSLIPALKHRLQTPAALVDLGKVAGLEGVSEKRGVISIGGRATHASLAVPGDLADVHVIHEAAGSIGDVQVRNRGTIGGSLVHADPAADWPAVFLALDGEAVVTGARGERTIPASQFFTGMLQSAVKREEVLGEVRLTVERKRAGTAYVKLRQSASGFALVGVAAQVSLDRKGRIERAAVGVTGVNPVPFRAAALEKRLAGESPDAANLRKLCARIEEADPTEDLNATAAFRTHLVGVYAARALAAAAQRAAA